MLSPVPAAQGSLRPAVGRALLVFVHKGLRDLYTYACASVHSAWGLGWGPKRAVV